MWDAPPTARMEGGGLSTPDLGEAHGGACGSVWRGAGHAALAGTRHLVSLDISSSSFLSHTSPPRRSPLSSPPTACAPSPAAKSCASVLRTRVSDRQSRLESSCSPTELLRAPIRVSGREEGALEGVCGYHSVCWPHQPCVWHPFAPLAAQLRLSVRTRCPPPPCTSFSCPSG